MKRAIFVLSTGRCGTQWLNYIFSKYYSDELHTTHEPLNNAYHPRKQLNRSSTKTYLNYAPSEVLDHINFISNTLSEKIYLETGYPCWSSIKYFLDIFKQHIKVIHLTREPLNLAQSWMTLGAYQRPILPRQKMKILLTP